MKPIADMPAERTCSDRTRYAVQSWTAHRTISAAERAVAAGTDDAFDRDLVVTLAMYHAELYGTNAQAQRRAARELRVRHRGPESPKMQRFAATSRGADA